MPRIASGVTERETADRVTSYGDRAVAAGDRATSTPAAPAPGATSAQSATKPPTAEVCLIDPKGLMGKSWRSITIASLEKDLNALYETTLGKALLQTNRGVRFTVTYRAVMTSKDERRAFGALQYPLYILNGHTNDATTVSEIEAIMTEHGIRNAGGGKSHFDEARDGWKAKTVEGLGIPPLQGYRKVGFIKADNIYASRGDFETLFRNIIKHELGHMFNMAVHSDQVMRSSIVLGNASLGYSETHAKLIVQEIARLRNKTEAELQAAYERANR
jgi:hypothetical protein